MSNVIVVMRVMPEGIETDLEAIGEKLKALGAKGIEKKPVAFGLSCLEAIFSIQDAEGGTNELETSVAGVPGVSSAEIIRLGREIDGKL